MEFKQVIVTPDGVQHATKAEAILHVRRPKIKAELDVLTGNNEELSQWLLDNQEIVEMAFETGTIRRVTKSERNKLEKALTAIVEANEPRFAFVTEHAATIVESFRWPSVKRMKDEEKTIAARNTLVANSEGNTELADWILNHREAILQAYEAGKEKRAVSPQATAGLDAYRAKVRADKEAKEAAKAQEAVVDDTAQEVIDAG